MNKLYKDIRYVGGEISLAYTLKTKPSERQVVEYTGDGVALIRSMYNDDIHFIEKGYAIMLDGRLRNIGIVHCGTGNHNKCMIDIRTICQAALLCNDSYVMLFHNHPSGSISPSKLDDKMTNDIKAALRTIEVLLMDHVIVTADDYYSYLENGKL